jgi:arylsulfatase A-like enzyme
MIEFKRLYTFFFTVAVFMFATVAHAAPNFIVIIADDMAWDDAGAYGHPHIRTPNIDRLAREGMRFDRAYLTTSSCSPSRCSILTGRYPHATDAGELHLPLPASQFVVTEALRDGGYYTAAAGKWHLGEPTKEKFDRIYPRGASGCEHWVEAVADRPKDQPFFLWLASTDPHRPYQPNTIPEPHTPDDVVLPPYIPDLPGVREDFALYYDEIARMDSYVGKVLAELERQGIEDDTCIFFMSDNGRPFPRAKTTIYDSGVRTPFIVRYPGSVEAGSVCESIISAVDLSPTMLDMANLDVPTTMQGRSFAPLLSDPTEEIREYAYAEHNWHDFTARERAVRSKRYLYIRNEYNDLPGTPPADAVRSPTYQAMIAANDEGKLNDVQASTFIAPRPGEELYDIAADPYSLKNLADSPDHRDTLKKMCTLLDEWSEETEDTPPDERRPDEFDRRTGERLKKK